MKSMLLIISINTFCVTFCYYVTNIFSVDEGTHFVTNKYRDRVSGSDIRFAIASIPIESTISEKSSVDGAVGDTPLRHLGRNCLAHQWLSMDDTRLPDGLGGGYSKSERGWGLEVIDGLSILVFVPTNIILL